MFATCTLDEQMKYRLCSGTGTLAMRGYLDWGRRKDFPDECGEVTVEMKVWCLKETIILEISESLRSREGIKG